MNRCVIVLLAFAACTRSPPDRERLETERRQARDAVFGSEVVESAKTPTVAGRLIYEPAADLSYDSARTKRPDLFTPRR